MSRSYMGRTLIIVNPKAQSGAAAAAAERLQRFLSLYLHNQGFDVAMTEYPRHATEIAANAAGYACVLALGGDGVIHEVASGLMSIAAGSRPVLGVVPVGSGNDFARTLGLNDSSGKDFAYLTQCEARTCDIVRITHDNGDEEYSIQTFSFGLDAAVGLGTHDLRYTTGLTGVPLYMASAARAFGRDYRNFGVRAVFDAEPALDLATVTFAVQNGPTYGSGFKICPDADPADGLMDICYTQGPAPRSVAVPVFLSAKNGHHVRSRYTHLRRAKRVELTFAEPDFPIQADGERVEGEHLVLECIPHALRVLFPAHPERG